MSYIPHTPSDWEELLQTLGLESVEELFAAIPPQARSPRLGLPAPLSELELGRELWELAGRNQSLERRPSFLGAGAYRHFVPAVVDYILRRGEFSTAYTPYQPEVSQGTLTAIYEFQTLTARLLGMEVANASLYDGATALAEAALMAVRITGRERILVSAVVHPEHRQVLATYTQGLNLAVDELGYDRARGITDASLLEGRLAEDVACLIVQHPNFFGCLEDLAALALPAQGVGALLVVSVDPIAMGLLKPPGDYGADIAIAEGQPLGSPLGFGGPYLGLLACRREYLRQMPGRLVGLTRDAEGRRGFVMTLQTREQHIRRERATSNICTNEALVALAAAVYLATLGKAGVRRVAELCYHRAHYAAQRITAIEGYELLFAAPFFKEFAVKAPLRAKEANARLLARGIVGGYELGKDYPELGGEALLFCVTEMNPKGEIDCLIQALGEIKGE